MPAAYGAPTDASGVALVRWSWAVEQLETARNYWICTTRRDGRPHAAPVWGVWLDGALWFSTSPESQKGRNIARGSTVLAHLESGDDVIIVEGQAAPAHEGLERFVEAYREKYDWEVDTANPDTPVYVLRPRVAQTWRESQFPRSAVRWVFS
jgi:hypothetical protein